LGGNVPGSAPTFRLLAVPGVTVDKWSRMWSERLPAVELRVVPGEAATLESADVDAGLVRLPVDRDTFDAITLYTEVTVAIVPRDHLLAAADELTVADLAGEELLLPLDDVLAWSGTPVTLAADRPATTGDAVALVAAGVGVLVVPLSLARLHHRRDLTHRVVTDAPTSSVALAWMPDRYTDLVEEMIGIVRGRTANSTRGRTATSAASATARTPAGGRTARPASGRAGTRSGSPSPRKPPRRRGR
jgi:DNA-binding transcriptional LysR family regulator